MPATTTLIGIVVLTQVPSPRKVAGLALIVAGVALHRPAAAAAGEGVAAPAPAGHDDTRRLAVAGPQTS
jgi:inner membrane transporter RhtA